MSNLKSQPTLKPTRKWQFGAIWSAVIVGAVAALNAYDASLGAVWGPVIWAIAGSLGFAVPAYITKNRG